MQDTLPALLEKMYKYISPAMISGACWQAILDKLKTVPTLTTPLYGFESKISHSAPIVDFSFFTCDWQKVLSRLCGKAVPHEPAVTGNPGTAAYLDRVRGAWLGYDISRGKKCDTRPDLVYFSLDRNGRQEEQQFLPGVFNFFTRYFDQEFSTAVLTALSRCWNAGDNLARPGDLGYSCSGSRRSVRLQLIIKSWPALCAYIREAGFNAQLPMIEQTLGSLALLVDFYILHLDISEQLQDRIGIELRLNGSSTRDFHYFQPRWQDFLDKLKAAGYCVPGKYRALQAWGGHSREFSDPRLYCFLTERFICHFKFVFQPGREAEVKCYFGFMHSRI